MDGKPLACDELLDLTRRQARQIDELRAGVKRLEAELERSAGNRSEAGAETHGVLASAFRTCRHPGRDSMEAMAELLRRGPGYVLAFDQIGPRFPPP